MHFAFHLKLESNSNLVCSKEGTYFGKGDMFLFEGVTALNWGKIYLCVCSEVTGFSGGTGRSLWVNK